MYAPYGDTVYDGLQTQLTRSLAHRAGRHRLHLSKTTNYADNGGGNAAGAGAPRIQYLPEKERNKGLAGYDRTHNFQAFWVWNLPFGRRAVGTQRMAQAIFGGWQTNGIWTMMSGTPIYIVQVTGFNLNAAGSGQIPDLVKGEVAIFSEQQREQATRRRRPERVSILRQERVPGGEHRLRAAAAVRQLAAQQLRGPGFWNVDLGLFRTVTSGFGDVAVPLRGAERVEPSELRESWQQHLRRRHVRVHYLRRPAYGERNIRLGARMTF